jgi:SulP family sulfate permease
MLKLEVHGTNPVKQLLQVVRQLPQANIPTQTAMVETSGGSSQLAHLSTALVVMLVLLFLTGPLPFLPVCVLGAIVFTIAVRLVDLRGLNDLHRKSPGEWVLALVTAASVVLFGVEDGILLAIVLSLLQHVRHSYEPSEAVKTQTADGNWQAIDLPKDLGKPNEPRCRSARSIP